MKLVGWKPFPWTCKCGSNEINIQPTNNPKDAQEVKVSCASCLGSYYTSGAILDIPRDICKKYIVKEQN